MDFRMATLACNNALFCVGKMPLIIIINLTVNILILLLIRNVINPMKTQLLIILAQT